MEKLLHFVWKHRIFPLHDLQTTDGELVEVIDPGMHNSNQGPDFFNAKVRIGQTTWVGNVEVHVRTTDWMLHNHHLDPRYDNTILHVVKEDNGHVLTHAGKTIPTLILPIPSKVLAQYDELCATDDYPRCHRMIPQIPAIKVHSWMDALLVMRVRERAERITQRVSALGGDWERATFVTLSRNMGFGLNGDAFERWANLVPLHAAAKHRSNLTQIEALFLGIGGLIDASSMYHSEAEVEMLWREWRFLSHKFDIQQVMRPEDWKFLRIRPQGMPQVRLRQLASLYHKAAVGMSALLEHDTPKALRSLLCTSGLSAKSQDLLIINTVVPLLFAYGESRQMEELTQRAMQLLETLPAEDNYILRQWKACGIQVNTAADSQALIQLKRNYCDRNDCLRCRFAYDFLKI